MAIHQPAPPRARVGSTHLWQLFDRAHRSELARSTARITKIGAVVVCRMIALAKVAWHWRTIGINHLGSHLVGAAANQLRDGLAELGPTFIKLGQVLSTRPDLVPPAFEAALSSLQDSAPPIATVEIRQLVSSALGQPVAAAFSFFDDAPIAAASIGQVHTAVLEDGREVVVKVRRPAIVETVELDLAILQRLARVASAIPSPLRTLDLDGFVQEFAMTIRNELDYLAEASNADRCRPRLEALGIHVPEVIWSHTRKSVLVLEQIQGVKIDDLDALDQMGVDRSSVARRFAEAYMAMVFVEGFFHADPHPGNLFVEQGGRIAMVDFGMVGTIAPTVRHALVEILLALSTHDIERSAKALRDLGVVPHDVDEQHFSLELDRLTTTTVDSTLANLRFGPLLRDLMAVSRRHHLRLPRELGLLVKTVVMCEGLAAQIDPQFSLARIIGPFLAATSELAPPTSTDPQTPTWSN